MATQMQWTSVDLRARQLLNWYVTTREHNDIVDVKIVLKIAFLLLLRLAWLSASSQFRNVFWITLYSRIRVHMIGVLEQEHSLLNDSMNQWINKCLWTNHMKFITKMGDSMNSKVTRPKESSGAKLQQCSIPLKKWNTQKVPTSEIISWIQSMKIMFLLGFPGYTKNRKKPICLKTNFQNWNVLQVINYSILPETIKLSQLMILTCGGAKNKLFCIYYLTVRWLYFQHLWMKPIQQEPRTPIIKVRVWVLDEPYFGENIRELSAKCDTVKW